MPNRRRPELGLLALLGAAPAWAVTVPPPTVPAHLKPGISLEAACASFYTPADNGSRPGSTELAVYVMPNGAIGGANITSSSGDPALDQAAVGCVTSLGSIFVPASIGIVAVSSWQHLAVRWPDIAQATPAAAPEEPFFPLR